MITPREPAAGRLAVGWTYLVRRRRIRRLKRAFLALTISLAALGGVSYCRMLNVEVLGPCQLEFGIGAGGCYAADISMTLLYNEDRERFSIQMGHDWWGYRPYPARFYFDVSMIYPLSVALAITVWLMWRDRRIPTGHCQGCGYDLRGSSSGRCPECGLSVADCQGPRSGPL